MATFENWGDYFWPGRIDECRRNLLGIRDPALLEREERIFLQQVARAAGLLIDWSKMPDQNAVMTDAFTVGYRPVAVALAPCIARLAHLTRVGTS